MKDSKNQIFNRKLIYTLLITFSCCINIAAAQNGQKQTGNWLMYFGMNKISDKLRVHTEVQYRNPTATTISTEQLLIRTGLNYHFSPTAFATAGYGYVASHNFEGEQKNPESQEHRMWQRLIIVDKLGRIKFEHRYRIEQCWVDSDYRNRFRYRSMVFATLNKPKIEKGTLFIGVYDEIFVNDKKTFFDRNRLYGALGYQSKETASLQVGILHQQLNDFGKTYL